MSGLIASAGHSGSHTPQSMHSSGMDDEHVLALVEAIHGANFDAVHILALDAIIRHHISHLQTPDRIARPESFTSRALVTVFCRAVQAAASSAASLANGESGSARPLLAARREVLLRPALVAPLPARLRLPRTCAALRPRSAADGAAAARPRRRAALAASLPAARRFGRFGRLRGPAMTAMRLVSARPPSRASRALCGRCGARGRRGAGRQISISSSPRPAAPRDAARPARRAAPAASSCAIAVLRRNLRLRLGVAARFQRRAFGLRDLGRLDLRAAPRPPPAPRPLRALGAQPRRAARFGGLGGSSSSRRLVLGRASSPASASTPAVSSARSPRRAAASALVLRLRRPRRVLRRRRLGLARRRLDRLGRRLAVGGLEGGLADLRRLEPERAQDRGESLAGAAGQRRHLRRTTKP